MFASQVAILFGAAGLAAAAPTSTPDSCGNDSGSTDTQTYGSFFVNKFVFGCTAGCYYSFDVSFTTTDEQRVRTITGWSRAPRQPPASAMDGCRPGRVVRCCAGMGLT